MGAELLDKAGLAREMQRANDWAEAQGGAFLRPATQVKTIWTPYGE